jgi:hypothetical protein
MARNSAQAELDGVRYCILETVLGADLMEVRHTLQREWMASGKGHPSVDDIMAAQIAVAVERIPSRLDAREEGVGETVAEMLAEFAALRLQVVGLTARDLAELHQRGNVNDSDLVFANVATQGVGDGVPQYDETGYLPRGSYELLTPEQARAYHAWYHGTPNHGQMHPDQAVMVQAVANVLWAVRNEYESGGA